MPDKEALSRPLLDDGKQQHVAIGVGSTKGEPRPSQAEGVVPIVLETRGLNYHLTSDKGQEKRILRDVNLRFQSGVLTAVMGPSGAGKTTLLNLLTGNAGGRIEGAVEVNGRPLKEVASRFKKLSTTVPQDDTLLSSLTPRETLTFAARLRLPMALTGAEKRERVAMVLEELSLTRCADQRIGNVDFRGISGGERKRTSIAYELLVNPSVMFVDEPTSGLDAKMAQDVVTTLQKLARQGRTLVCTIHQPSYKVFQLFDRLVLLSLGAVVYAGPISKVEAYFSSLGYNTPHGDNPADYFMRVLQLGPEDEDENGKPGSDLPALWRAKGAAIEAGDGDEEGNGHAAAATDAAAVVSSSGGEAADLKELDLGYTVPRWYQMLVLFQRAFIDGLKDSDKFLGGLILKAAVGLLVGIVWLHQARTAEQKSIFPLTGALFIATTSSVLDTVFGCILTFPSMKALLLREYKNGTYSLAPFYLATLLNAIVFNAFYAIFLATPIFFLVGDTKNTHMLGQPFDPARYFLFLALLALLATIGAALGLMVGSLVKDVQQGQQACMPTLIPLLLFSGYLIPYAQIPSYFKWLYHCSPFAYAMSALQIVLFKDVTFTDCLPPPCPNVCYGGRSLCFANGQEYLDSVNANPDDLGKKFGLLVAIFSVFLCGGYVCMSILVRRKTN